MKGGGKLSLSVNGVDQVKANLEVRRKLIKEAQKKALVLAAFKLHTNIVHSISSDESIGRTYTHYFVTGKNGGIFQGKKRNKPHIASKPGDAPNIDDGKLVRRLGFDNSPKAVAGGYRIVVRSADPKSAWL